MEYPSFAKLTKLSPFELKDTLIQIASSHAERTMLNAGRGNPNFLATIPRQGFFLLGQFAVEEAERSYGYMREGVGGLPERAGIEFRFEVFLGTHRRGVGGAFLKAAFAYARDALGLPVEGVLFEMVESILGCQYPVPPRMLHYSQEIVRRYLLKEMTAGRPVAGNIDLFATEGGAAAITYVFNTLRENRLIAPGDSIALGMPIFTPYIEIPQLGDYQLVEVLLEADEQNRWQYPDREIDKLADPKVKAFFLVNPGNPTSVKISDEGLARIAKLVTEKRHDLIILTDDVYGTFADDFVSLFTACPHNTILAYSYSKYFGATGWRLGVIAMHEDNALDRRIAALPQADLAALDDRYKSLVAAPRKLKFIDRLVADSRSVGLNHVAGLSCPQQVQMVLFSLFALVDERDEYKAEMKRIIRRRYHTLYRHIGADRADDVDAVDYYTLIDLEAIGARRYGRAFADWLLANKEPTGPLARLADEGGVVLLPGQGFGTLHPSARVSLANLRDVDYARIGEVVSKILHEYHEEFTRSLSPGTQHDERK